MLQELTPELLLDIARNATGVPRFLIRRFASDGRIGMNLFVSPPGDSLDIILGDEQAIESTIYDVVKLSPAASDSSPPELVVSNAGHPVYDVPEDALPGDHRQREAESTVWDIRDIALGCDEPVLVIQRR